MDNTIAVDIQTIVDAISSIGFVGLLIILAIPTLRTKFGFNGIKEGDAQEIINKEVKDTLQDHSKHLAIANQEMGEIRDSMKAISDNFSEICGDVKAIKKDIEWLKRK